jgi:hypothetical protein
MKDTLLVAQMDAMMVVLKDIAMVVRWVELMVEQKAAMMDLSVV